MSTLNEKTLLAVARARQGRSILTPVPISAVCIGRKRMSQPRPVVRSISSIFERSPEPTELVWNHGQWTLEISWSDGRIKQFNPKSREEVNEFNERRNNMTHHSLFNRLFGAAGAALAGKS